MWYFFKVDAGREVCPVKNTTHFAPAFARVLWALLFFCAVLPLGAYDFGLAVQQTGEAANTGADNAADGTYHGIYTPWFSTRLGETATLYLSVKVGMEYEAGAWKPAVPLLPELGRFAFSWRPGYVGYLEAGRLRLQDPPGLIATGLADGINGSFTLGAVRVTAGAFYTGLLYKESAKIVMNPGDIEAYAVPVNYNDMATYFASRRVVLAATGEFAELSSRITLALHTLAQFDVNPAALNGEAAYHSQYAEGRVTFELRESLTLSAAAVAALAESWMESRAGNVSAHFATAFGVDWEPAGSLQDLLQGELRWSSGAANEHFTAFKPLNAIAQGQVFTPTLSALMTIKGKYTARPHRTFSASLEGAYFIRTDGETLTGAQYPASGAYFLGAEFYGSLLWAPVSDLMLTLGGGFFLPQWGNAFVTGAPVLWKVQAGLILSL
jgi:hypothetical protein